MKTGKRLHILRQVLKQTGAQRIWVAFVVHVLITAAVIWLIEPGIDTYGKALWYCYAVITTIGFGDIVAQRMISRVLSILLSIDAALVIALVTGVVVNFYNQITTLRNKETLSALMDKLERLPELSKEELAEISQKVRDFQER